MIGFKRILFPTDLSEESFKPLPYAIELARAFDGEIFFIYVLPVPPVPEADFGFGAAELLELESRLIRDAEESLERFLKGRIPEGIRFFRLLAQGHAAEESRRDHDEHRNRVTHQMKADVTLLRGRKHLHRVAHHVERGVVDR